MQTAYRRIQIYFRKAGENRFLSHLDLVRTMDRAIRRSGLPAKFTEGMNPKVKMSFPTALPLGMTSHLEIMEIQVAPPVTVREVCEGLAGELPEGLRPTGGEVLYTGERRQVREIHYAVFPSEEGLPDEAELQALLSRDRIPVLRRGKERDLKPLIREARRGTARLHLSIAWTDKGTARPQDVLKALGRDPESHRVEKVGITVETSYGEKIVKRNGPSDPHQ